jgi:hypothetical protein
MPLPLNQLAIIMPTPPSQAKDILVSNYGNEMTLFNNLDNIYEVDRNNKLN